jgi:hypothetical protein
VREIDEGRIQPPPESAVEGPAISISLGDASDVDPELLAGMCGPDGLAIDLTIRLPRTLAAMEAGTIDLARAGTIAFHIRGMTDEDAAYADAILAAAAPGQRHEQLARKAATLELKLAPAAVAARKTLAKQDQQVEARREESGNASCQGRSLTPATEQAVSPARLRSPSWRTCCAA